MLVCESCGQSAVHELCHGASPTSARRAWARQILLLAPSPRGNPPLRASRAPLGVDYADVERSDVDESDAEDRAQPKADRQVEERGRFRGLAGRRRRRGPLFEGDAVIEARCRGGPWYPGALAFVHEGGDVDVQYDDGDEKRVPRAFVRRLARRRAAMRPARGRERRVLSPTGRGSRSTRWDGDDAFYAGTVEEPQRRDGQGQRSHADPARQSLQNVLSAISGDAVAEAFFAAPVDPVQLQIPDYFDVVKNPMDLGTVAARLKDGVYDEAGEVFAADVRLTFDNAMLYNNPSHIVHVSALRYKKLFDELYASQLHTDERSCPICGAEYLGTRNGRAVHLAASRACLVALGEDFESRMRARLGQVCKILQIERFDKPDYDVEETVCATDDEIEAESTPERDRDAMLESKASARSQKLLSMGPTVVRESILYAQMLLSKLQAGQPQGGGLLLGDSTMASLPDVAAEDDSTSRSSAVPSPRRLLSTSSPPAPSSRGVGAVRPAPPVVPPGHSVLEVSLHALKNGTYGFCFDTDSAGRVVVSKSVTDLERGLMAATGLRAGDVIIGLEGCCEVSRAPFDEVVGKLGDEQSAPAAILLKVARPGPGAAAAPSRVVSTKTELLVQSRAAPGVLSEVAAPEPSHKRNSDELAAVVDAPKRRRASDLERWLTSRGVTSEQAVREACAHAVTVERLLAAPKKSLEWLTKHWDQAVRERFMRVVDAARGPEQDQATPMSDRSLTDASVRAAADAEAASDDTLRARLVEEEAAPAPPDDGHVRDGESAKRARSDDSATESPDAKRALTSAVVAPPPPALPSAALKVGDTVVAPPPPALPSPAIDKAPAALKVGDTFEKRFRGCGSGDDGMFQGRVTEILPNQKVLVSWNDGDASVMTTAAVMKLLNSAAPSPTPDPLTRSDASSFIGKPSGLLGSFWDGCADKDLDTMYPVVVTNVEARRVHGRLAVMVGVRLTRQKDAKHNPPRDEPIWIAEKLFKEYLAEFLRRSQPH
ncbi:hypothetical protein SO694_00020115 [Aureococcus anophagefferens]|uniref:Bromo domain-containing protein n=1 Tax=Aureococcus anophagefferens TaxID=44056 RepID=A0ABR1FTY8_AURAN